MYAIWQSVGHTVKNIFFLLLMCTSYVILTKQSGPRKSDKIMDVFYYSLAPLCHISKIGNMPKCIKQKYVLKRKQNFIVIRMNTM